MDDRSRRPRQRSFRIDAPQAEQRPRLLKLKRLVRVGATADGARGSACASDDLGTTHVPPPGICAAHHEILKRRLGELRRLVREPVLHLPGAEPWLTRMEELGQLASRAVAECTREAVSCEESLSALVKLLSEEISDLYGEVVAAGLVRRAVLAYAYALQWFRRLGTVVDGEISEIARLVRDAADRAEWAFVYIPCQQEPDLVVAAHAVNMAQLAVHVCLRWPEFLEMDTWAATACLLASLVMSENLHLATESPAAPIPDRLTGKYPLPVQEAVEEVAGIRHRRRCSPLGQLLVASDALLADFYAMRPPAGPTTPRGNRDLLQSLRNKAKKLGLSQTVVSCVASLPLWCLLIDHWSPSDDPAAARASAA